ncbi:MAG TPA: histidine phosphatase family protein [Ktedonobacterales bacterium]
MGGATGGSGAQRLYLVRHGQSDKNALPKWRLMTAKQYDKYLRWQVEAPLTAKGAKQVKHTARWIADVLPHPERIYADTSKRTRETAKLIAKILGVQFMPTSELREVHARGFARWLPPLPLRVFILLDRLALFVPWPHEGTWYSGLGRARRVLRQVSASTPAHDEQSAIVVSHHLFIQLMLLYARLSPGWRVIRRSTKTAGASVVERR